MVRESPVVGRRRGKPKRTPVGQFADAQLAATTEQLGGMVRKTKVGKSPKVAKNDICSICLNQIVKPSLCSGCFHHFCFSCITKWANISSNCPVCRKKYKNILHNFNTSVRIVRLGDERSGRKKQRREQPQEASQQAGGETAEKSSSKREPFYIFETSNQQMIGIPIIDDEQVTNNIVQLNMNSVSQIPEIDIINMTKNENGGRIITRHNYQLVSGDQQELVNELLSSAINQSVEEHQETISQVGPNASEEQSNSILNQNKGLTRLIDVYTLGRTRRQRGRGRNRFTVRSRYNLRPIEGMTRVNPQVNRARLIEWQM